MEIRLPTPLARLLRRKAREGGLTLADQVRLILSVWGTQHGLSLGTLLAAMPEDGG
jgi:hypothetical protein